MRRLPGVLVAVAIVVGSVAAFPGAASAALPVLGLFRVKNHQAGKCIVSRDPALDPGAVTETACNTKYADEWWTFYKDPVDPSYVHLQSYDKGTCLVAPATQNIADLAKLATCGHSSNQEWFVHYRSTYFFILQNKQTGRYLVPQADGDWSILLAAPVNGDPAEEWEQLHAYDDVAVHP